jgi:CRISPR-associated endonuclease/helicase Cas3
MARDLGRPLWQAWGKARPAPDAVHSWHPLVYHCLDVAAVGETVLHERPDALARLAARFVSDVEAFAKAFVFLLALHDIGKLSRSFQAKVPELWPQQFLGPLPTVPPRDPGHPVTGAWFLQRSLAGELAPLFPGWSERTGDLLAPFVGHHGRPVSDATIAQTRFSEREMFGGQAVAAAQDFLATMRALFEPDPLPKPEGKVIRMASWSLAGLTVLADWIGSRQSWFPYATPERDARAYLTEVARPRAAAALRLAGIAPARPSTAIGYRAIAGQSHHPTPAQSWAESVQLPEGPFVAFVEDVTGGGKTEAALILAHRLLAAGRARGLYVALPTMATANAMYDRLAAGYRRLFADGRPRPSLSPTAARASTRVSGRASRGLPIRAGRQSARRRPRPTRPAPPAPLGSPMIGARRSLPMSGSAPSTRRSWRCCRPSISLSVCLALPSAS